MSRPGSTLPNKPTVHLGQGQAPVKPQPQQAEVPTTIMRAGTPMNVDQRGKKREREDGNVVGMNGVVNGVAPSHAGVLSTGLAAQPPPQALTTNGYGNGIGPPKLTVNARAGTDGIRPRPIKKQKMVSCSSFSFFSWVAFYIYLNRCEWVDLTCLFFFFFCSWPISFLFPAFPDSFFCSLPPLGLQASVCLSPLLS